MNKLYTLFVGFCISIPTFFSQSFTEGFEDLTLLTDWYIRNNSPQPNTNWGGGSTNVFNAQAGTAASYLSVNFNSTSSSTGVTLSNWLFTPTRTYNNGDVISFYTKKAPGTPVYPDRLEVRMSTAGNGMDVGTTETSVGTFTTLLLTINPTLTTIGYPTDWTQYTITISGLAGPTNGRVALRYFVTNGGPGGANSDYIGVDSYTYTSVGVAPANDNCANAINLTQGTSCVNTSGTVAYATSSQVGCAGTANNDVWYQFNATSTGAAITVAGSPDFDGVFQVFTGISCAQLTSLNCTDASFEGEIEANVVNNLIIGQTYYIRVYDYSNTIPNTMTFDICVEQFTQCNLTQPANSLLENETCGTDNNGGCNSTNPIYYNISCGQTIFGNAWADNNNRDTDWYRFQLGVPGNATLTATAEFPFTLLFVDVTNCLSPTIFESASFNACQTGSITYNFPSSGNYAAVILPSAFSGYACNTNNDYIVTLTLPTTNATISTNDPISFCANGSATITASETAGGFVWQKDGVAVPNQISSSLTTSQAGTYTLLYTNTNGCQAPVSNGITLSTIPSDDASFSYNTGTVCVGSQNVTPTATLTGTYSASSSNLIFVNTSTGEIDVVNSTPGTYTITFTTNGTCPNSSTQQFSISNSLVADFEYGASSFCTSDANQQVILLNGGGNGLYSSTNGLNLNSQTGEINPSLSTVGTYVVTNTIAASGTCPEASATFSVTINGTVVDFPSISTVCQSASVFGLVANPIGGTFSGSGVVNSTDFDPSVAQPSNTITYTYVDANNCSNSTTQTITVEANPVVSFGSYNPICANAAAITLNTGLPAGGSYIGNGVLNNVFTPTSALVGTNNLVYNYVSPNGCTGNANGIIIVNPNPTVTFDPPTSVICAYESQIEFTDVSPAGGTFSGTGMSAPNIFNVSIAGIGTHQITYTVTQNGCSSSVTQSIEVDPCASVNEQKLNYSFYPNPSTGMITIKTTENCYLSIYTLDGKKLTDKQAITIGNYQFDCSAYAKGQYLLILSNENSSKIEKLILE